MKKILLLIITIISQVTFAKNIQLGSIKSKSDLVAEYDGKLLFGDGLLIELSSGKTLFKPSQNAFISFWLPKKK